MEKRTRLTFEPYSSLHEKSQDNPRIISRMSTLLLRAGDTCLEWNCINLEGFYHDGINQQRGKERTGKKGQKEVAYRPR